MGHASGFHAGARKGSGGATSAVVSRTTRLAAQSRAPTYQPPPCSRLSYTSGSPRPAWGFLEVYDSLEGGGGWCVGALLWAASLVVLLATAPLARPIPSRAPTWKPEAWPMDSRLRRGLLVSVALVLVAGAAARLIALDSIPLGVNADEGDRAASAMSLLSGRRPEHRRERLVLHLERLFLAARRRHEALRCRRRRGTPARCRGRMAALVVVVAIAYRNFGHRMALLTAVLGSALGVCCSSRARRGGDADGLVLGAERRVLLEAGRRGGTWPWVAAGIAGALSLYFYPGRLWLVLAALVGPYLVVRAADVRRAALAGTTATALAALLTLGPFLANAPRQPRRGSCARAAGLGLLGGERRPPALLRSRLEHGAAGLGAAAALAGNLREHRR